MSGRIYFYSPRVEVTANARLTEKIFEVERGAGYLTRTDLKLVPRDSYRRTVITATAHLGLLGQKRRPVDEIDIRSMALECAVGCISSSSSHRTGLSPAILCNDAVAGKEKYAHPFRGARMVDSMVLGRTGFGETPG
jgi:hypothetical protein